MSSSLYTHPKSTEWYALQEPPSFLQVPWYSIHALFFSLRP